MATAHRLAAHPSRRAQERAPQDDVGFALRLVHRRSRPNVFAKRNANIAITQQKPCKSLGKSPARRLPLGPGLAIVAAKSRRKRLTHTPVSYTHLTLPTLYSV